MWTGKASWQDAMNLNLTPDIVTWNTMLAAWARCSEWQRSLHLFEPLLYLAACGCAAARGKQVDRAVPPAPEADMCAGVQGTTRNLPDPDLITYNSVINACAKGACWKEALAVYTELDEHDSVTADEPLSDNCSSGTLCRRRFLSTSSFWMPNQSSKAQ